MSEMVERVAKALKPHFWEIACSVPNCEECERNKETIRDMARTAIAAMREPTKPMIDEGWRLIRGNLRPDEIFPHMIDAALTSTEKQD